MQRTWRITGPVDVLESVEDIRHRLFSIRNIDESQQEQFLSPTYETATDNPFSITDMQLAVERLLHAAKSGEHILVLGDYDADGVSGTAVLVEALRAVGANVAPYLPHRSDEGYGLNKPALTTLIDTFDLLLTVDCGISNVDEVEWVRSQNKDVIIVDHHEIPPQLPPALAILHPRHPSGGYTTTHLSGAGMGWKLAQGLLRQSGAALADEKWLLDLPLLGTLADSMPLVQENRAIVRFGMDILRIEKRL